MDGYVLEARFTTVEDAEKALKKCKTDTDFRSWLTWALRVLATPGIIALVGLGLLIAFISVIFACVVSWFYLPGSYLDRLTRYKTLVKNIDKTIAELRKNGEPGSEKLIAGLEDVKMKANKELNKYTYNEFFSFKSSDDHALNGSAPTKKIKSYNEANDFYSKGIPESRKYMDAGVYESYIQTKIDNEQRLIGMINNRLSLKQESTIILEAKASDKIKAKWNKLVQFLKGVMGKFMETMSNVLLDQKEYLEKYKDIILKKKPKEDLKFSYTGNYEEGINRLINTELPIFNYAEHYEACKAEGDEEIIKKLQATSIKGFNYDTGETDSLATQFKDYFLDVDAGQNEGNFTQLNMTNIYNFCYNFDKIKSIVNKDQQHLERTTAVLGTAMKDAIRKNGGNPESTEAPTEGGEAKPAEGGTKESYRLMDVHHKFIREADAPKPAGGEAKPAEKKDDKPQKMQITTNTNAVSQMSTYANGQNVKNNVSDEEKKGAEAAGAEVAKNAENVNDAINEVTKVTDKWIRICRALITAKLTACEQISRDYMDIIRAHVRSYGGKDDKNDQESKKGADEGTNYAKNSSQNKNDNKENKTGEAKPAETGGGGK